MAELAPDHGPDLRHLLHRRQPVEPGQQRVAQRIRDRQGRQRARQRVAIPLGRSSPASSTALVSSSTNSGTPSVRATMVSSSSAGSSRPPATLPTIAPALPPPQAAQGEAGDVGVAGPVRAELGAEGDDEQNRQRRDALDYPVEQLERGRVTPVRVLQDQQDGAPARQALELRQERPKGARLPLLRGERREGMGRVERQAEQVDQVRQDLVRGRRLGGRRPPASRALSARRRQGRSPPPGSSCSIAG